MKKIAFLFILSLSIITQVTAQTQNSIVSLPPNFIQFSSTPPYFPSQPQPLPAPGGSSGFNMYNYDAQEALFNHNAMQDINGNPLFFVVDGVVYHGDGTAVIDNEIMKNGDRYEGFAETMIVPNPGNCQRYYIFTGQASVNFGGNRVTDSINSPESLGDVIPGYAILDLSIDGTFFLAYLNKLTVPFSTTVSLALVV